MRIKSKWFQPLNLTASARYNLAQTEHIYDNHYKRGKRQSRWFSLKIKGRQKWKNTWQDLLTGSRIDTDRVFSHFIISKGG